MAQRFSVEPAKMLGTLKATAFKGDVSNEQMMALLIVADQYGLNPWTKEIYAFPDRQNGIVPVIGVDGWARIINTHPQFDGMDFEQADDSCTCIIYRKDRAPPGQGHGVHGRMPPRQRTAVEDAPAPHAPAQGNDPVRQARLRLRRRL